MDGKEERWPSDETLELAAVAAEDWKKHGNLECVCYQSNEDGFR